MNRPIVTIIIQTPLQGGVQRDDPDKTGRFKTLNEGFFRRMKKKNQNIKLQKKVGIKGLNRPVSLESSRCNDYNTDPFTGKGCFVEGVEGGGLILGRLSKEVFLNC